VQETLIHAARRFSEWVAQTTYPFHVWLRLLCAQSLAEACRRHLGAQMRDARRETGRAVLLSGVSSVSAADFLVASQTSPTQAVRREELRTRVLAAVEELEPMDREILSLRHFEGLSNEDAALELGIEPAAASKRYVRALQRLRPALAALAGGA
jgi:RNA polymerase sigma-70 factor (ECF subfamily)